MTQVNIEISNDSQMWLPELLELLITWSTWNVWTIWITWTIELVRKSMWAIEFLNFWILELSDTLNFQTLNYWAIWYHWAYLIHFWNSELIFARIWYLPEYLFELLELLNYLNHWIIALLESMNELQYWGMWTHFAYCTIWTTEILSCWDCWQSDLLNDLVFEPFGSVWTI